jgi:hypothetical protein
MSGLVGGRERRIQRSSDPLVALSRLLDATRREAELEVVAVGDQSGCLVAGAGAARACEELAAVAPLVGLVGQATAPENDVVPTRLDVLARRLEVRRLRIDGVEVLISCQGDTQRAERALERAAAGCQRILGSSPVV